MIEHQSIGSHAKLRTQAGGRSTCRCTGCICPKRQPGRIRANLWGEGSGWLVRASVRWLLCALSDQVRRPMYAKAAWPEVPVVWG